MTDEYISKEASIEEAIDAVDEWSGGYNPHRAAMIRDGINTIPAADVAPVRHGRWVMNDQSTPVCSRCGNVVAFVSHPDKKWDFGNYCPNCGALMDKEETE